MKKQLVISITILFIVSSLAPMVIGYDGKTTESDEDFGNLTIIYSDRYGSSNLVYYK